MGRSHLHTLRSEQDGNDQQRASYYLYHGDQAMAEYERGRNPPAEELPESITVTLYRHVGETKAQYGDSVTVRPDENGEWSYTWEGLPRKDETGAYCTYSVEETDIDGYETSYRYPEDGGAVTGIDQGEIQITNTKIISFVLPETGGLGTPPISSRDCSLLECPALDTDLSGENAGEGGALAE